MPSALPKPTVAQLRNASVQALIGQRDIYGDRHDGAIYDHVAGPTAILFAREADRDHDLFADVYFDSATGYALTRRGLKVYNVPRILDTYGVGFCELARSSDAAGGDTFYQGTRIQVAGTPPAFYEVAQDTPVGGTVLNVIVPIQALQIGTGVSIQASSGLSFIDPIYDPLWKPQLLSCADGTDFEEASAYRARCRQTALLRTVGYQSALTLACQKAGARYVIAFASNYGLPTNDVVDDYGLNAIYVADANYQSPAALVTACAIGVEAVRVLGADLQVGGVAQSQLAINALVTLTLPPSRLPLVSIRKDIVQSLLGAFGSSQGGYLFKLHGISGAIKGASTYVQTAAVSQQWKAVTEYNLGDVVVPNPRNGRTYQCILPGGSGASQPAFPLTTGQTIVDGNVTWACTAYPQVGLYAAGVLQTTDPTLSPLAWPSALPRYTLAGGNIVINFTGPL